MRLYELLAQSTQQQLDALDKQQQGQVPGNDPDQSAEDEDDGQGQFDDDKVTGQLQDVAQGIADQDGQPDPYGGQASAPPELDQTNVKPIDSALLSQIKNLPFSTRYQFKDNAPLNPLNIAAMSLADLTNLSNMVRFKMQNKTMQDRIGLEDDIDMQFYTDLLKFINTVVHFKKSNTGSQLAQFRSAPSWQNMQAANSNTPPPKNNVA